MNNNRADNRADKKVEEDKKYIDENGYCSKPILELNQKDKVHGHIYVMTCSKTGKQYVGGTVSHRKNHEKYRFYGYIGRFNSHISEATTNIRKIGGCIYLNSIIREHGKDSFNVKLITKCHVDDMGELERKYIAEYNTLHPNGYNVALGGKGIDVPMPVKVEDNGINTTDKRGRGTGFKHTSVTKDKMKEYFATETPVQKQKRANTMRATTSAYYADKRAGIIAKSGVKLDDDFKKFIRPHHSNGVLIGYTIRLTRDKKLKPDNPDLTLEQKYWMCYDALEKAYEIQQNSKSNEKSEDDSEKESDKRPKKKNIKSAKKNSDEESEKRPKKKDIKSAKKISDEESGEKPKKK